MMNQAKIWIQHPAYTDAQWTARNPLLLPGEVACIRDGSGVVTKIKIGPGYYIDLAALGEVYEYSDTVTNPIGDALGILQGLKLSEIVHKMLNPYGVPVISNLLNDANGAYLNVQQFEVGQSIPGPIHVKFNISNPANLLGSTPITVDADGMFSNEGNFANGIITLNFPAPYNPISASTIEIKVTAVHLNGVSQQVITTLKHSPRLIWGVSPNPTLSPGDWASISQRKTLVSDNFERDFDLNSAGYGWLAIPSMLGPGNLVFAEVSNSLVPVDYDIIDMGVQTFNNGVTSYSYQTYRTFHYITASSILRVKKK